MVASRISTAEELYREAKHLMFIAKLEDAAYEVLERLLREHPFSTEARWAVEYFERLKGHELPDHSTLQRVTLDRVLSMLRGAFVCDSCGAVDCEIEPLSGAGGPYRGGGEALFYAVICSSCATTELLAKQVLLRAGTMRRLSASWSRRRSK